MTDNLLDGTNQGFSDNENEIEKVLRPVSFNDFSWSKMLPQEGLSLLPLSHG